MAKANRTYGQWRLEKLSDPVRAARYLNAAKKDSKEALLHALKNVIQANQVAKVAREARISRESVYRSFSAEGNPTLDRLLDVFKAVNIDFDFCAALPTSPARQSGPNTVEKPSKESVRHSDKPQALTLPLTGMPRIEPGLGIVRFTTTFASGVGCVASEPLWQQAGFGKPNLNTLSQTIMQDTHGIRGLAMACVIAEHSELDQLLNVGGQ
jgi:probable addiction module antidote protein